MKNREYEIEMICINCEHAVVTDEEDTCVCDKKGKVDADDTCRSFKLDLLKIKPSRIKFRLIDN